MLFKVNQVIYMSLDNSGKFTLKSRVAEVSNDTFTIEMPINEETGKVQNIPDGNFISVWYNAGEKGQFFFTTNVKERMTDNIPLIVLEIPPKNNITKIQRRDFLRIETKIEASIQILNQEDNWVVVNTMDLSGGGLQFILSRRNSIKKGDRIKGWLVLPFRAGKIEHVNFYSEVVRVHSPSEESNVYWVSVKFTDISEGMRAKVIRFVFERQVELKNKGLL